MRALKPHHISLVLQKKEHKTHFQLILPLREQFKT